MYMIIDVTPPTSPKCIVTTSQLELSIVALDQQLCCQDSPLLFHVFCLVSLLVVLVSRLLFLTFLVNVLVVLHFLLVLVFVILIESNSRLVILGLFLSLLLLFLFVCSFLSLFHLIIDFFLFLNQYYLKLVAKVLTII